LPFCFVSICNPLHEDSKKVIHSRQFLHHHIQSSQPRVKASSYDLFEAHHRILSNGNHPIICLVGVGACCRIISLPISIAVVVLAGTGASMEIYLILRSIEHCSVLCTPRLEATLQTEQVQPPRSCLPPSALAGGGLLGPGSPKAYYSTQIRYYASFIGE
jgi:hypothetical protein